MLTSVRMSVRNGIMAYPEELKEVFLESGGLDFKYWRYVSAEEIWDFMTKEAPRKYPYHFSTSQYGNLLYQLPDYVESCWNIKLHYMRFTYRQRFMENLKNGIPLVFIHGGQNIDPYVMASSVPLRPMSVFFSGATKSESEGRDFRDWGWETAVYLEEGRREVSSEACNMAAPHQCIKRGDSSVALIAPLFSTRCSDMAYLAESHRSTRRKRTPVLIVDYPVNAQLDQEWAIDYLAKNLRRLVQGIKAVGGKEPTDEECRATLRLLNRGRRAIRNFVEVWRNATLIPGYSNDFTWPIRLCAEYFGDPVAGVQIAEEAYAETKERVEKGIKGAEIAEDPVRLYILGSCFTAQYDNADRLGAAVVGMDDYYNRVVSDIEEEGDPYRNMALAMLSFPIERPTIERARWIVEDVIKSRADGVIHLYQWGCQYQSAAAHMIADIIKKETGLPALSLQTEQLARPTTTEQVESRIISFVEMLRAKRGIL